MTEIEAAFSRFKGKRALVMGLGLWQGGVEAVKFLHRWGASEIVVTDLRDEKTLAPSLEAIKHIPVTLRLGEHRESDFARAQVVIHSPAVRPDNKYLEAARQAGAEVTQEMSLFIEACPAKSVGITGSNGKTTTTLLCYEMLCEVYERAQPELENKWA
ncbi:partial UDP-N-acetylmuramoylalanine--D-glutamate ligase, partial [Planctomycetaceae bacterium]